MKKRIVGLLALGLFSVQTMALTLNEARQQGRVGETQNGYIAALKQDKETAALVQNINQARSQSYQQLAETNNIPVNEVAKLAGKKLIAKAQPGEYVQGINGKWVRK
ncbi:YdbL family probable chaperone protein [Pseudocitrobacter cyperus]